jgi:hypothetical protein
MDSPEIIAGVEPEQREVQGSSPALCWICSHNPATTREHWLKRADLVNYLRPASQENPLLLHRNWKPHGKVAGPNSKLLKFEPSICEDCNSHLTQPYDRAWDALHGYLRGKWQAVRRAGYFDLRAVFPDDPALGALHVQLYFAKLYGCLLHEERVPIDLRGFARSVYHGVPHPDMALGVCHDDQNVTGRKMALRSEIHVWGQSRRVIEGTVWLYLMSPIGIKVFWRTPRAVDLRPIGATWHPLDGRTRVRVNRGI